MNKYTFSCNNCGHCSDELMDLNDDLNPIKCSKCDSTNISIISCNK